MALSDKKIIEEMKTGNVVIDPFNRANLATSSYDVTLGEWYFREQKLNDEIRIFNIYSKSDTEKVWGLKPFRAKKAKEVLSQIKLENISPEDRIVLLGPGETILAHTNEFIGGKNVVTTMMKARSSLGRSFITVCKCAGWGDVGYTNRWTMEITNTSDHYMVPLVVGRRIAQIVFFYTGPILAGDYTKTGKYHSASTQAATQKAWKPEMMLPTLYKDRDIKK